MRSIVSLLLLLAAMVTVGARAADAHRHHHGGGSRSYGADTDSDDYDADDADDADDTDSDESQTSTTSASAVKRLWRGTHNHTCRTFYDCDERQTCVSGHDADEASVCRCQPAYVYDAERQYCRTRYLACEEYCDLVNGYECIRDECRWSYRPPGVHNDNSGGGDGGVTADSGGPKTDANSTPSVGFFSLFAVAILIVLLIWKCTMQRRLNQLIE